MALSSYKEFAYICDDDSVVSVTIKENFRTDFSSYVWPSAPIFSKFLCDNAALFRGKKILELGSGTGVCGIVAAKLGARVLLTDRDESSLVLAKENIQSNQVEALTTPLVWGDTEWVCPADFTPEIVIASDIFYDRKDARNIVFTIYMLLEKGGSFYYAYQDRTFNTWMRPLLKEFHLRQELVHEATAERTNELIRIYKITNMDVEDPN